jgi:hypothetical protein
MAAIVVGIVVAAAAQSASALQLTPLEEFSRRPTARMVWSQAIARIDSDESHAVVTAVVFDDSADPKGRMSGVRVDLVNATGSDQVYIAESALELVRSALEEIAMGIDVERAQQSDTPFRYLGAALFWHPNGPRVHELNPAFYISPNSSGLSISTYGAEEFRFPNRSPAQLATALADAVQKLKSR